MTAIDTRRLLYIAEHLFQMVPQSEWRKEGADDGQGHYEGDYHAAQLQQELADFRTTLDSTDNSANNDAALVRSFVESPQTAVHFGHTTQEEVLAAVARLAAAAERADEMEHQRNFHDERADAAEAALLVSQQETPNNTARELIQEVIDNHVYVGNESNYCVFCGRWPDDHEDDCLIHKLKAFVDG